MSVRILKRSLKPHVLETIMEDLTITNRHNNMKTRKKIPQICAYKQDEESIRVPISYFRKRYKKVSLSKPKNVSIKRKQVSWREGQEEVFEKAIKILHDKKSLYLKLHCGWGKTFISLHICARMNVKTLILVHRKFLGDQFLTEAENVIQNNKKKMFFLEKGTDIPEDADIVICTDRRINIIDNPDFFKKFKMVIVDEAKYWCSPTRTAALLNLSPYYMIALCAEKKRPDGFHKMLDLFYGTETTIYRRSTKPYTIWKYQTSWIPTIEYRRFGRGPNWNVAMRSLAELEERNKFIVSLCCMRPDVKIMILVAFTAHVDDLWNRLRKAGIDAQKFYMSNRTFKSCRVLVSTYSKAEMGFDDKNLCENFDGERLGLMILGAFYKSDIEQSVGRILRHVRPEVIDITDDYSSLKKHSEVRDKYFRSSCGTIMPTEYIYDP